MMAKKHLQKLSLDDRTLHSNLGAFSAFFIRLPDSLYRKKICGFLLNSSTELGLVEVFFSLVELYSIFLHSLINVLLKKKHLFWSLI